MYRKCNDEERMVSAMRECMCWQPRREEVSEVRGRREGECQGSTEGELENR